MKKRALWKTALFVVLLAANVCVAFLLMSTLTGESSAAEIEGQGQPVAPSAQVLDSDAKHPPPDLPEVKPRVEILPPSPSVYDSVPEESLTTYVAKVNGDPVSVRLFERRLARNRFSAFQHFGAKYGAKPDADFWTTSYQGETPAEWLRKRTLEECARIKVELGLAKENGVIADTSYAAFLRALDRENERRTECLAKGEPIYGPQQYKEDEFFLYLMNNARIATQKRLAQETFTATDETLEKYYESVKDRYFDRGYRAKVWAIEIIYGQRGGYPESLTRDEAKAKIEEAKKRLDKGERFEDVASEYNEDGSLNDYYFDHETRSLDKSHRASKREEAMRLSEGEISDIYDEMNSFFILKCIEKERLGHEPYEEVRGAVRRYYVEAEYQSLVGERVEAAEVEVNSPVYQGIAVR
jgi:hypothetical protein